MLLENDLLLDPVAYFHHTPLPMSRLLQFVSAASLALESKDRDLSLETDVALLDLRKDPPAVAIRTLKTISERLGSSFYVNSGMQLLLSAGRLRVEEAARIVASGLDTSELGALRIATVHGEDMTSRIEELTRLGHDLRDQATGQRLVDEPTAPDSVWTPAPTSPLVEALESGAQVVICQWADPGVLGIAATEKAFGGNQPTHEFQASAAYVGRTLCEKTPPVDRLILTDDGTIVGHEREVELVEELVEETEQTERATLYAQLPDGAELRFLAKAGDDVSLFGEAVLKLAGINQIESWPISGDSDNTVAFHIFAESSNQLRQSTQSIELLCHEHRLQLAGPLEVGVQPIYRMVQTTVPSNLLEFGHTTLSALEWRD